jgi:ATP-dependent RNA helicase DeaD
MPFLGAHPSLLRALVDRGLTEPTAVQRAILEVGDPSADLMVSAQTGSGKTVAFGLAIAPTILGELERFVPPPRSAGAPPGPLALVVTPTRELAMQVARELAWLYAATGATVATCVGGMDPQRERQVLNRGPQFVVGTPGRLCDHIERGSLVLSQLKVIVLDEADEMLDMGFRDELERILQGTPPPPARRTLLFSATIPPGIAALAKRYQRDAIRLATAGEAQPHADITYQAITIRPSDRVAATINVLRFHESPGALVFCATRDGVQVLTDELAARGFAVVALSGELSQRERTSALAQLRDGRARVLVATDVAARGLDLPDLDLVIHADLPQNRDVMIHRSGRTGRAGRKGTSVLLVPMQRRGFVDRILSGKTSPLVWGTVPTAEDIQHRDVARLDAELAKEISELDERTRAAGWRWRRRLRRSSRWSRAAAAAPRPPRRAEAMRPARSRAPRSRAALALARKLARPRSRAASARARKPAKPPSCDPPAPRRAPAPAAPTRRPARVVPALATRCSRSTSATAAMPIRSGSSRCCAAAATSTARPSARSTSCRGKPTSRSRTATLPRSPPPLLAPIHATRRSGLRPRSDARLRRIRKQGRCGPVSVFSRLPGLLQMLENRGAKTFDDDRERRCVGWQLAQHLSAVRLTRQEVPK